MAGTDCGLWKYCGSWAGALSRPEKVEDGNWVMLFLQRVFSVLAGYGIEVGESWFPLGLINLGFFFPLYLHAAWFFLAICGLA